MLKGIGASQGFGIGKAVVIRDMNLDYSAVKYTSADEEKARLHRAVDDFVGETKALVEELKKNAENRKMDVGSARSDGENNITDPIILALMGKG